MAYTSIRDMFDGGGPGQSGDTFGGALGGVSNAVGATPAGSGDRSGSVYQGPTQSGSAGYYQDPGLMSVDSSTGFITSDENTYRPAPVLPEPPAQPAFDALAYLSSSENRGFTPSGTASAPAPVTTDPTVADPNAPSVDPAPVLPPLPSYLSASDIGFNPETQFTFEEYLRLLQQMMPGGQVPQVAPLQLSAMSSGPSFLPPIDQGIGSLPPLGIA